MERALNIVLVNDDSIHAEGIRHLAEAVSDFGRVWIVAPARQCSAMAHRVSIRTDMKLEKVEYPVPVAGAWSLEGMPADCVKVAINYLLKEKPDLILSGINHGINLGFDTYYSGTVSAAIEGAMHRIPSIAVSNEDGEHWQVADSLLREVLKELIETPAPEGCIWNVNFPACSPEEHRGILRGMKVAGRFAYAEDVTPTIHEDGTLTVSQDGASVFHRPAEPGTDLWAVQNGYTSIGAIRFVR